MTVTPKPMFRKAIYPFYDSEKACIIIFVIMLMVFLFGISGISAAREDSGYSGYVWVPILLSFLSSVVMISAVVRIVKHIREHIQK
jgi:hypothetical protein